MSNESLSPNSLALIALANEYCQAVEQCLDVERMEFVNHLLKVLPRLYITVTDADVDTEFVTEGIDASLDEATYDQVRSTIAGVMAADDVYLETQLEDMKYSDTPIATTMSENLADIYQVMYDFVAAVRNMPTDVQTALIAAFKASFIDYWGQTLCNVVRALHSLRYAAGDETWN